jgi:hypothetical protein
MHATYLMLKAQATVSKISELALLKDVQKLPF